MTEILDERAVSEIEARDVTSLRGSTARLDRIVLTVAERDALCATVKHLREDAKSKKIELLQLSGRGDLLAKEHVKFDSLDEVAAMRNEFDRLRNIVIRDLQSQLEQLRAENETLRSGIRKTLDENGHLADGENCTLIHLKRAIGEK